MALVYGSLWCSLVSDVVVGQFHHRSQVFFEKCSVFPIEVVCWVFLFRSMVVDVVLCVVD